jgi:Uma2 family endonuclease
MAVTGTLLSVAEFARLPQPAGGVRQELHHGELVELPPVKKLHTKLPKRLVSLLEARLNPAEHGLDTADDDYFCGVPAIVIEVLSQSNSASERLEREEICLRHGGREFWLIDPGRESVKVIRADGRSSVHDAGSVIESGALGGSIAVRDIFAR